MRAVVLVGGEGTRLRPLTLTTPKQMLPVAGVRMIERVVGHLARHGVDEAILSLGYRPDAFLAAFPRSEIDGVALVYATEPEPLDTGGAIGFAAGRAGMDDTFLVVNGDVLTDVDVSELLAFHRRRGARATISLTPVDDPSVFGVVPTEASGRVTAFIEKPPVGEAPTNLINAGTYVMEPGVLEAIVPGRRVSVEREVFPSMVAAGELFALASDAYWIDAGTPAQLTRASLDLIDGTRSGPPFASAVEASPGVWAADRVGADELAAHPGVRGPCLVGARTTLGTGAEVASSVIGSDCQLGSGAKVIGSVLLDGVRIGAGAVVADCVIGFGAVVGSGADLSAGCVLGDRVEVGVGQRRAGEKVGS